MVSRKSKQAIALSGSGAIIFLMAITYTGPVSATSVGSCRQHPQLIGSCFNLRGRLSVYNGAPAIRLWKVGTRRMLGISEQRFAQPGFRNIPEEVEKQLNGDVEIFGDYTVCPFTKAKVGEMQLVCIERAKNLIIRKKSQQ